VLHLGKCSTLGCAILGSCTVVFKKFCNFPEFSCNIPKIDIGNDIYVWCGPNSNPWERMKANEMGRGIRDDERAGKAEVYLIDAGEVQCPEKLEPYLGDLPDDIADEAPEEAPSKGIFVFSKLLILILHLLFQNFHFFF